MKTIGIYTMPRKTKNLVQLISKLEGWDEQKHEFVGWKAHSFDCILPEENCVNFHLKLANDQCVCGKKDIVDMRYIANSALNKWARVGSTCIALFDDKQMARESKKFKDIKDGYKHCIVCHRFMKSKHDNIIHDNCKINIMAKMHSEKFIAAEKSVITFGRYKGKTWKEVFDSDKIYIKNAINPKFSKKDCDPYFREALSCVEILRPVYIYLIKISELEDK